MNMMEFNVRLIMMIISTGVFGGLVVVLLRLYYVFVIKPEKMRCILAMQGIKGPSPSSFIMGNISDITSIQNKASRTQHHSIYHDWPLTSFAYLYHFTNLYGPIFTYSAGSIHIVCITDLELINEIIHCTSLSLGKPSYLSKDRRPLLGRGILASNGPIWAHQRNIIAPELYLDMVKTYVRLMVESSISMVKSWESRIGSSGGVAEIRVDKDMQGLAAEVISRTCFGSNYSNGQEILSKLGSLIEAVSKIIIGIPGQRYLPTENNRKIRRLEKKTSRMILKVVKERSESSNHEKGLLQRIHDGARNGDHNGIPLSISSDKFTVDNCKNIFFAGHQTSALTASWCFMLLAAYPEWQDQVRAEILDISKGGPPDADMLHSLKTVTAVIQETLRLYPPAGFVFREALNDVKFKNILIPKGMAIQVPIPIVHQNPDVWGPDAHQFNPARFENGVTGACRSPQAYIPFGAGPRICAGQNFAMAELKVIIAVVLPKFSFALSPKYQHSPVIKLNLVPRNGITLQVKRV